MMQALTIENGVITRGGKPFILRGFGLGGWLLPEGYMWNFYAKCDRPRRMEALIEGLCGPEYAQGFWNRYFDSYISREDIDYIADHGFNSVRLPLNARHLCHEREGLMALEPGMIKRVDDCISWCRERGLYVILDMHAAPGGQTGQNIDDSENDEPALFMRKEHEERLLALWVLLAQRYKDEAAVAGYDLLNEPLPNWHARYNDRLLPLYRRLMAAISAVDKHSLIILEGLHWATDFSVFEDMSPAEAAENRVVLEFHKYWSSPDEDSLLPFIKEAKRLNVPLYLGESGENNLDWYTTLFPLCERLGIGWNFWTYKKMSKRNSPVSFAQPEGWADILAYLDQGEVIGIQKAREIFDSFLDAVLKPYYCEEVLRALCRVAPVTIPAEAFDEYDIHSSRRPGAVLRMSEPVTLLFADGHTGLPDYQRYGGEPQPESERIDVQLSEGDMVGYRFTAPRAARLNLICRGEGAGVLRCGGRSLSFTAQQHILWQLPKGDKQTLEICCTEGTLLLDRLELQ